MSSSSSCKEARNYYRLVLVLRKSSKLIERVATPDDEIREKQEWADQAKKKQIIEFNQLQS